MSVDLDTVRRVAELARLQFQESELASLAAEMNQILSLVDQLASADVTCVLPLTHPGDPQASLRLDVAEPAQDPQTLQQLAPQTSQGYYLVPRVLE